MADKTDDLIISISTDLATVRRQLKQFEGLIQQSANNAGKSFKSAGKQMDEAFSTTAVQERINRITGIATKGTKEWTGALANQGKELQALKAKFSPLYAAQQKYLTSLNEIKAARAVGAINAQEMAGAIAREKAAFAGQVAVINGTRNAVTKVGYASKLTSNQMLNLSRQGNDVITMFALGAPPMQIFASQIGQVVGALEEGPGGLKGSLKAIGGSLIGLVNPATAGVAAFAALGAAIVAIGRHNLETFEPLEKRLDKQIALVKELADSYGDASVQVDKFGKLGGAALGALNSEERRKTVLQLKQGVQDILNKASPEIVVPDLVTGGTVTARDTKYPEIQGALDRLATSAKEGTPDVRGFVEELGRISSATDDTGLKKFIADLIASSRELVKAQDAVSVMVDRLARVRRVASEAYRSNQQTLRDFVPDRTTDLEKIQRLLVQQYNAADQLGGSPRAVEGIRTAALRDYNAALKELQAQEANRRAGVKLDIAAITARTAAEKANIAAERERIALEDTNLSQQQKLQRIEEARQQSLAESRQAEKDSARNRALNAQQTIDSAQLEIATIGKTSGEVAALQTAYQLLQQAKADAYSEGREVGADEIARIKDTATKVGELAQQYERLQLARDATLDRQSLFMSDGDARIADKLRGTGLGMDSQEAAYLRVTDQLKELKDLNRDVWKGFGEDIIMNGVKPLEALQNALKKVAANLLDKGLTALSDNVFNSLFGGQNIASSVTGGISQRGTPFNPMYVTTVGGIGGLAGTLFGGGAGGQPTTSAIAAAAKAIKSIESGGNYNALGPITKSGDRAYGAYQIMGANVGPWSKAALGYSMTQAQMLANPGAQDAIFNHRFGGYMGTYGATGAAQAWFGGPGAVGKTGAADMLGTTVGEYGKRFNAALGSATTATSRLTDAAQVSASGLTTLGKGFGQFGNNLANYFPAAPSGGGGGGIGGLFSKLFGGPSFASMSAISPGAASFIAGGGVGLFADGGVSNKPAIFGEAGAEAAVPLPDGRRIPVDLRMPEIRQSAQSSNTTIHMPITIDARNADAAGLARVQTELQNLRRSVPKMVDQRVDARQTRKTRP